MNKLNNIFKSKKVNKNLLIGIGSVLFILALIDIIFLSIFSINLTNNNRNDVKQRQMVF